MLRGDLKRHVPGERSIDEIRMFAKARSLRGIVLYPGQVY